MRQAETGDLHHTGHRQIGHHTVHGLYPEFSAQWLDVPSDPASSIVDDLVDNISTFVTVHNHNAALFRWTCQVRPLNATWTVNGLVRGSISFDECLWTLEVVDR